MSAANKKPDLGQAARFLEMVTGSKTTPVTFTIGGLIEHKGGFAEHQSALVTANAAGATVDVTVPGCTMVSSESPDPLNGVQATVVVHVASPRVGEKVYQHWYVDGEGEAIGRLPGFTSDGVRCQVVSARDGLRHTKAEVAKAAGQHLTKINGKAASVAPEGAVADEVQDTFDSIYLSTETRFPTITYTFAQTVKNPSRMSTKRLDELAAVINKVEPVPQEKIDALKATGLEGKALNDAVKVLGIIIHPGIFPDGAMKRTKDNIEASTGAAYDFDYRNGDRTSRADVQAAAEAKGVAVILWNTYSSAIEAGDKDMTFRALFPFSESQPIDTHAGRCDLIAEHLGFTAPGKPLPVVQGFFVAPRIGRTPNAVAVPGRCIDEAVDFSNLPVDADAAPDHQERATGASHSAGEVLTPEQVADATAAIDALRVQGLHGITGKGVWHRVIGALAPYGEQGEVLALRFSEDGCKTWKADTLEKLAQKRRKGATGIGNLFAIAAEQGITNPGSGKRPAAEDEFADDLAGVFDEAPAEDLTPDVRKHMNACIDMTLTLREGGFRDLHGPVRAMQNDAGKVIRQNADGTWQAEGGQPKDAADLLVSSIYKGDAAAAESEWLVWAEDGEQMNWFSGHVGRSGAYSAQALVTFMRNKVAGNVAETDEADEKPAGAQLKPTEPVIDGFIMAQTIYVGGGQGVGKTSVLVPLACIASGELSGFEMSLKATLTRKVIYFAEDPEQIERVRYGLKKHCGLVENGNFFVAQAKRRSPEITHRLIKKLVAKFTVDGPNGYKVKPLIVFDTTNACFDIENENDASQVGKLVNAIKTASSYCPVWLVGHLAKTNLNNEDVKTLSGRGSGAWEADVTGTYFIITIDGMENARAMEVKKKRFEPHFFLIQMETKVDREDRDTEWGTVESIGFRYGVPEIATKAEREAAKAMLKATAELAKERAGIAAVAAFLGKQVVPVTKEFVEKGLKGGEVTRDYVRSALAAMIEAGDVLEGLDIKDAKGRITKSGIRLREGYGAFDDPAFGPTSL